MPKDKPIAKTTKGKNANYLPTKSGAGMTAYCVYGFTNKINNKKYIGLTSDIKRRYRQHKSGRSRAVVFCLAIEKYGFDNFDFEILKSNLTLNEAKDFEKLQISTLNTMVPNGYNRTEGGDTVVKHTNESIEKIIEKNRIWRLTNAHPMQGKKHSEETKKLQRESALKRIDRPSGVNHWNYGKKTKESTKEKISIKQSLGNNGFAKKVIDLNTNIVYSCISEAKLVYNISHSIISMICSGKRKSNKYNFMYLKDYDKKNSIVIN
jgi:group I intron endonuclease